MTQHMHAPPYNPGYQQLTPVVLRSPRLLGQAVIGALAVVILLELLMRIGAFHASELLRGAAKAGQFDEMGKPEDPIATFEGGVSVAVALLLRVPVGILFICWLWRVSSNLGVVGRRWRPGWTIGGWFIPIAYLAIPIQVVDEIDRLSDERAAVVDNRPQMRARWVVLALWWIGLLIYQGLVPGVVASVISGELARNSNLDVAASRLAVVGVNAGAFVLIAGTAALAILLVRRITANQERLLAAYPQYVR